MSIYYVNLVTRLLFALSGGRIRCDGAITEKQQKVKASSRLQLFLHHAISISLHCYTNRCCYIHDLIQHWGKCVLCFKARLCRLVFRRVFFPPWFIHVVGRKGEEVKLGWSCSEMNGWHTLKMGWGQDIEGVVLYLDAFTASWGTGLTSLWQTPRDQSEMRLSMEFLLLKLFLCVKKNAKNHWKLFFYKHNLFLCIIQRSSSSLK